MKLRKIKNALRQAILRAARVGFLVAGRNWNDFYAWMLDTQDRRLTIDVILAKRNTTGKFKGLWDWERGEHYVRYLERHGWKPEHAVLDYGCGYGRVTIPLLRRQARSGKYYGTEISERRLQMCRDWIAREGLDDKHSELILSKDNAMPFLGDKTVDIIWVLSVFNHMPDDELRKCLASMARVMRPNGILFAYYLVRLPGTEPTLKTFLRSDTDMAEQFAAAGLKAELMDDWDDDLAPENRTPEARLALVRHA